MGDSNMRIRQMDGLRAVAALAVVMIHVSAGRMNPVGVSCNQTARFAVPLFIMLSGYGHMYSWLQHSGQSAVQTAKRRLKRVLPAYLVWSVLYLAVDAVFGKPHAHPIKNILTGGSYVHLYYIFILVQLILLSELFCRAVERHPAVTLLLSAGLTIGSLNGVSCGSTVNSRHLAFRCRKGGDASIDGQRPGWAHGQRHDSRKCSCEQTFTHILF